MSDADNTDTTDIDTCQAANEAALERGLSFCQTPEARVTTLARFVGFESTEIDAEEILNLDVDDKSADVRKRVLARTEELIDGGEDQPLDAINQAWADVDFAAEVEPEETEETEADEDGPEEPEDEPEADPAPDPDDEQEPDLSAPEIDVGDGGDEDETEA